MIQKVARAPQQVMTCRACRQSAFQNYHWFRSMRASYQGSFRSNENRSEFRFDRLCGCVIHLGNLHGYGVLNVLQQIVCSLILAVVGEYSRVAGLCGTLTAEEW